MVRRRSAARECAEPVRTDERAAAAGPRDGSTVRASSPRSRDSRLRRSSTASSAASAARPPPSPPSPPAPPPPP
ncbi:secretion system X translation initiation factor, partial [Jiangella rhizosphaerae]